VVIDVRPIITYPLVPRVDYVALLVRAGQLTWRHPVLWVFGFLATSALVSVRLAGRRWLDTGAWQRLADEPEVALELLDRFLQPPVLIMVLLVLLTAPLLFWFLNAVAEGGLIRAVAELDRGGGVTAAAVWRVGLGLVVPFLLIDTALFLPLFLLFLFALLLASGGLIGLLLLAAEGSAPQIMVTLLITGGACVSGLLLLSLPLTLLTLIFRLIAFRCAALDGLKTMAAIRQAGHIIRYNAVHVLLLVAIAWVASLVFNLASGAPIGLLGMGSLLAPEAVSSWLPLVLFMAEWLRALLHAILFVFTAALWTLAYQEFGRPHEAPPGRVGWAGS
jgi:hypothetical protein